MNIRPFARSRGERIARFAGVVGASCALMAFSGCDEYDQVEAAGNALDAAGLGSGYHDNVTGHWVGTTGAGGAFTMDLNNVSNNWLQVTGSMTRDGVTGALEGSVALVQERFSFTVTWPDASETTGSAHLSDDSHMDDGTLTDSGAANTFTAVRP